MNNEVLKTDGNQQKLNAGILVLRFRCLTAGIAVSSILGTPLRVTLENVFKGWIGVKNHSHHHMEWAEWLDPARRVHKDEMEGCVYNRKCYLQGLRRTPDTTPATPPSNPTEPLTHRALCKLFSDADIGAAKLVNMIWIQINFNMYDSVWHAICRLC